MEWPLLSGLPPDEVRRVLAHARRRRFAAREVLFHEGDLGDSLYLVDQGRVAIRVTTAAGDTATLAVLGPGTSFGELALFTERHRRTATALALEATETLSIGQAELAALRARYPQIDRVLIGVLVGQVQRLTRHLVEALYVPVEKRVLRRLLALAEQYADGGQTAVIPLTQEDLGGLAGASRATVNQVLRKFEESGAMALHRGRIEILDRRALLRAAQGG